MLPRAVHLRRGRQHPPDGAPAARPRRHRLDAPLRVRDLEIDKGQPWGTRAQQALAGRVFQQDMEVKFHATDAYGRTLGRIWLGDRDIKRQTRCGGARLGVPGLPDRTCRSSRMSRPREEGLGVWSMANQVPALEAGHPVVPERALNQHQDGIQAVLNGHETSIKAVLIRVLISAQYGDNKIKTSIQPIGIGLAAA